MAKFAYILTFLLFSFTAADCWAETYRWVDDNGIVNYAERLPRDVPANRVTMVSGPESPAQKSASSRPLQSRTSSASTNSPRSFTNSQARPELNANQQEMLRGLEQNEADRVAQVAKVRQDNCDRSRRVLENLTAKEKVRVRSETGIERSLPENERQNRISAAQRGIVENCEA